MITFQGYPQDGGLYAGYNVLRDDQVIGFIDVCGVFRKNSDSISLTEDERLIIREACKKAYEMPSEWGCLGVGESPAESFEEFAEFRRRNNIRHDLD